MLLRSPRALGALLGAAGPLVIWLLLAEAALGQPTTDIVACASLASRLATSAPSAGTVLTIDGEVHRVDAEGAGHQLVVCQTPSPMVLCITEAADERQVGERVVVSGRVSERGANFLRLEPCSHRAP